MAKSTLLQHLNGCLVPKAGRTVRIDAFLLTKKTLEQVPRTVGMVFQDPDDQLFLPTIYDDVAYGPLNPGLPSEEVMVINFGDGINCSTQQPTHNRLLKKSFSAGRSKMVRCSLQPLGEPSPASLRDEDSSDRK